MYKTLSTVLAGLSIISFLSGFTAFVYFLFYASNINAAVWALLYAVFSVCSLHLFILFLRRTINDWYAASHLENISSFGLVIFLLSSVAVGVYLSLAITRDQTLSLDGFSFYPATICAALNGFWSFTLFLFALSYKKYMIQNPPLLRRYRSYS